MKSYFSYSAGERRAILFLSVLLVVVLVFSHLLPGIRQYKPIKNKEIEKEIQAFCSSLKKKQKHFQAYEKKDSLFYFDPNTLTDSDWEKLGFNTGQIKSIRKYLFRGGRFATKEDLKKMYVISDRQYERIKSYIKIEPVQINIRHKPKLKHLKKEETEEKMPIDINFADSSALVQLKGIGPVFAKRIISYRTLLGGYYTVNQLIEVYGFDQALLSSIKKQIITSGNTRKININKASFKELVKHPYIDYNTVKKILYYRNTMGDVKSIDELCKENIIQEKVYEKVKCYLTVE
jgi:DNA uptake protein ComE-like DNA-binding protein